MRKPAQVLDDDDYTSEGNGAQDYDHPDPDSSDNAGVEIDLTPTVRHDRGSTNYREPK